MKEDGGERRAEKEENWEKKSRLRKELGEVQ